MICKKPVVQLTDFLSHFAKAGGEAAQAAAKQSREHLLEFFDLKDGEYTAKTVKFKVGERDIEVPLLAISQPANVKFRDMELEFSASVNVTNEGGATVANHKGLLKRAVDVNVTMHFESQDAPEGFELIRDRLNRDLSEGLGKVTIEATPIQPATPIQEE